MDIDQTASSDSAPALEEHQADRLSRFLAMVLRHRAHRYDLRFDDEGYIPVDELLEVIQEQTDLEWVVIEHLQTLTHRGERQRFEITDAGMRALYGHSFHRRIRYDEAEPPEELYVGIPKQQMSAAQNEGVRPDGRQYVHLSEKREETEEMIRRREDDSRLVTVRAREASQNGVPFYRATEGLFLAAQIPSQFLDLEVNFGRRPRKGRRR